ncbi:xanthine dehydrogenase subunit XdhB [Limisalsivibrio acetivorans]|uniref:xanthine dehydrogenase subunit XdhB n=1 Tax=Limisalsivibrio acetivorans TaxID=1304888 RepID=UPI0003B3C26B|nr:xanthine dehydrogenase subunit XdhB [Limisalsivibrio acetivorans]
MFDIQNYVKAESIKDAVRLLSENEGARLIAGGTDVLIKLREGDEEFSSLVDIHNLEELRFIDKDSNGDIRIGSAMDFTSIIEHPVIKENIPVVAQCSLSIGGPQVRNVATIGGNLCNGAISADSICGLVVLDAVLETESIDGAREIPMDQFYLGPGKTVLGETEVLKNILIKRENYENRGAYYYKYAMRDAMDIATIGCGASCSINNGKIEDFRIVFTVAAPKPTRALEAEEFAVGQTPSEETAEEIAKKVMSSLNPRDSWRASKAFRTHIIQTLAKRVAMKAMEDAGAEL